MQVTEILEAGASIAWKRQGSKVSRKYRCTSGPRKGQVRASPAACNAPINVKRRYGLKQTKAKLGSHRKVMSKRTKTYNPASKRLKTLNKPRRRKTR
jgi:hypothetical protein